MSKLNSNLGLEQHMELLKEKYRLPMSECRLLIYDVEHGEDERCRVSSATYLGLLGCRSMLNDLIRVLDGLLSGVSASPVKRSPSELKLIRELLFAVGWFDTHRGHDYLVTLISESKDVEIRSYAIDATATEKRQFDTERILNFLDPANDSRILMSALYALEYHNFSLHHPERAQQAFGPLLVHADACVRRYAVTAFRFHPNCIEILAPLKADASQDVRSEVESAIREYWNYIRQTSGYGFGG